MATLGQRLIVNFAPVPVPSGWAPPVIVFKIFDPITPVTIVADGIQQAASYMQWHGALVQVEKNLGTIADAGRITAKKLSNVEIAISAWSVALSMQTALIACQASSQILANNFAMEQSPNKPVLPTPDEQLKENMKNALTLTAGSSILSNTVSFVSDQAAAISIWITKTETYKSVTSWLEDAYKTNLAPITDSARNKLRAGLGAIGLGTPTK